MKEAPVKVVQFLQLNGNFHVASIYFIEKWVSCDKIKAFKIEKKIAQELKQNKLPAYHTTNFISSHLQRKCHTFTPSSKQHWW